MLCLPENNEVFYFNRLIPKNTHVNSFLLRYLIIGVSAAAYPGITWQNGECVRIKSQNKQTEGKRPSICFVQQWPLRSRGECYVMQLPLHPLQTNLSHCETHRGAKHTAQQTHNSAKHIVLCNATSLAAASIQPLKTHSG